MVRNYMYITAINMKRGHEFERESEWLYRMFWGVEGK